MHHLMLLGDLFPPLIDISQIYMASADRVLEKLTDKLRWADGLCRAEESCRADGDEAVETRSRSIKDGEEGEGEE